VRRPELPPIAGSPTKKSESGNCWQKLGVPVNTISFHTRQIFRKLQMHSRSAAVAKALRTMVIG